MKSLLTVALTLLASPALAHSGPEALDQHFVEHLFIALMVGVPAAYLLLRQLKRKAD